MGRKQKYVYNESSLQYERHSLSRTEQLFRGVRYFMSVASVAALIFTVAYFYFPSPKEKALEREQQQMKYHYGNLLESYDVLTKKIEQLHEKDSDVHRMIFGLKPTDDGIWNGGIGGVDRYAQLDNYQENGEMMKEALVTADRLKRKVSLQTKSLDSLYSIALSKQKRLASIPSIKPVVEDKLKRKIKHLSGYGIRLHPVHKVKKMHQGIDFTAPKGTAIQATGDGVVVRVENKKFGYGINVMIDHGYGFKSLYAHMSKVNVRKGDKVKKGQLIGAIGSTGTSTGPHLHYEVRINNRPVNPIDYVLDGLTPEEYRELVSKAAVENQSFD